MLSNPSQVLVRNKDLFQQGSWLLAGAPDGSVFHELAHLDVSGFHQMYDVYTSTKQQTPSDKHHFGAALNCHQTFDGAVVYMPKAKAHARMLLANVAASVKPGGMLMMVGDNKGGVKSAAKLLEIYGSNVNKIDAARHCSLYATEVTQAVDRFELNPWFEYWDVSVAGISLKIASLPGVFSHGELDAGTRLLLENTPKPRPGFLYDFACGAGVIGCFLGKMTPKARLLMSDVSALALTSTEETLKLNNVSADVVASDGLSNVTGQFDAIYTNPPFHTGIKTDYGITERFIAGIKSHLKPGASLTLVANRFLKYPDLLERNIGRHTLTAQTNKFNLYYCQRPR